MAFGELIQSVTRHHCLEQASLIQNSIQSYNGIGIGTATAASTECGSSVGLIPAVGVPSSPPSSALPSLPSAPSTTTTTTTTTTAAAAATTTTAATTSATATTTEQLLQTISAQLATPRKPRTSDRSTRADTNQSTATATATATAAATATASKTAAAAAATTDTLSAECRAVRSAAKIVHDAALSRALTYLQAP